MTPKIQNSRKRFLAGIADRIIRFIAKLAPRSSAAPLASADLRHIVVLRLDHIGDVVLATPMFRALRERFPEARISAVVGPWSYAILAGNAHVDQVLCLAAPWWANIRGSPGLFERTKNWLSFPARLFRLVRTLRRSGVDLVIDPRSDLRHILLIAATCGATYRLSYRRSGGESLLTHCFDFPVEMDEVSKNLALLAPLDVRVAVTDLSWNIDPTGRQRVRARLAAASGAIAPYAVFHPGARARLRRWPAKRYAELARRLYDEFGLSLVIVGSAEERAVSEELARLLTTPAIDLTAAIPLEELGALLAEARLFVGNDSGPSHIAAAVGTPSIVLLGPTPPDRIRPVAARESRLYVPYPCSPCLQTTCERWDQPWGKCIDDILVEAVYERITNTLGRGSV